MILKGYDEVATQESIKLATTGKSYKSWNTKTKTSGSPLPPPVQSTLVTFVESEVSKKAHSDW